LISAYQPIKAGKKQVDAEKEANDYTNELPQGQIDHGIENTEAVTEGPFFVQVEGAVLVYETAAIYDPGVTKTGVVVYLRYRVYLLNYRHGLNIYFANVYIKRY
jgi:hypothetical protein